MRAAEVAVVSPVRKRFSYLVPPRLEGSVEPGARVLVPFGRRKLEGYFLKFVPRPGGIRLREIDSVLDEHPLLSPRLVRLGEEMAERYFCSVGEALAAMLPAGAKRRTRARKRELVRTLRPLEELKDAADELKARAPKQAEAVRKLAGAGGETGAAELRKLAGASAVRALVEKGLVELVDEEAPVELREPEFRPSRAQEDALRRIERSLDAGFSVHLVHGVTGSGKTELYVRAIGAALRRGKRSIVLVPEISLTPQTLSRFRERFRNVAVLHSHLTGGERAEEWEKAHRGEADVVIGARSAVFAPVEPLGLIVVDEEHEPSYKQESTPRYHAREVAMMRARIEGACVVLGSASPSLESFRAARTGAYILSELPGRVGGGELPPVEIVDMEEERRELKRYPLISRRLKTLVDEALARGEQAILFLNRRGYHTFVRCARCDEVVRCQRCDVSLTYHKKIDRLVCHHCGKRLPLPEECPSCSFPKLILLGPGSERVEDEVNSLFPFSRVARMDSDAMRARSAYEDVLGRFGRGELDILVGTQMLAKGLDFPKVTVVGIVNADVALHFPDFRASERTFQLIMQVAGRSGRSSRRGRVVVQTFSPSNPAVVFASEHDYEAFASHELESRKEFNYPPFARLARIILRGRRRERVKERAERVASALRATEAVASGEAEVVGPSPAPIQFIRGEQRFHLFLKAADADALARSLWAAESAMTASGGVHATVDVDPVSML